MTGRRKAPIRVKKRRAGTGRSNPWLVFCRACCLGETELIYENSTYRIAIQNGNYHMALKHPVWEGQR